MTDSNEFTLDEEITSEMETFDYTYLDGALRSIMEEVDKRLLEAIYEGKNYFWVVHPLQTDPETFSIQLRTMGTYRYDEDLHHVFGRRGGEVHVLDIGDLTVADVEEMLPGTLERLDMEELRDG